MPESRARRKRRRSKGSVTKLQQLLWATLSELKHELDRITADGDETDTDALCRLSHAISQTSAVYLRNAETSDFEERLRALEATSMRTTEFRTSQAA